MGTNFYALIPIHKRNIDAMEGAVYTLEGLLKKLREDVNVLSKIKEFSNTLSDEIENTEKQSKIHLGRRSAGWAFLWDIQAIGIEGNDFSLESLHKWLLDNKAIIIDEYGEQFNWDNFIKDEIGYCLYPSKKPLTLEELHELSLSTELTEYIKQEYFQKGIPYYKYYTTETYYKTYPKEKHDAFNIASDYINKHGLRIAKFTNFS